MVILQDKTRQDDLFNSAQFYKTYKLDLHRQLNTIRLRNKKKKEWRNNKIGIKLGSSK